MNSSSSKASEFLYTLKRSRRARRLRLVVRAGGEVEVIAPYRVPLEWVEKAVEEKREWIEGSVKRMEARVSAVGRRERVLTDKEIDALKIRAREIVIHRLEFFAPMYQLRWNNVTIKAMRTRWGSCSTRKNLNFNYRIALLPQELVDYIVVHELCHLARMDHSPKFWALVAKVIPDFAARRRAIRNFSVS